MEIPDEIEIDPCMWVRFPKSVDDIEVMECVTITPSKPSTSTKVNIMEIANNVDTEIQKYGRNIQCKIRSPQDLSREIKGSKYAKVHIHELYIQILPWKIQNDVQTIKSLIDLSANKIQEYMKSEDFQKHRPTDESTKLKNLLDTLDITSSGLQPFTISISDITGMCEIQTFCDTVQDDKNLHSLSFIRTISENQILGISECTSVQSFFPILKEADLKETKELESMEMDPLMAITTEGIFDVPCEKCSGTVSTNANAIHVPYFSKILIMTTFCDTCCFRNSSIFSSDPVKPRGMVHTLIVTHKRDLQRFICKGNDAILGIKELDFHMKSVGFEAGFIGTLDDILRNISQKLSALFEPNSDENESTNPDSNIPHKMIQMAEGKIFNYTLYIDDPSGRSYIQNMDAPDDDPQLTITNYKRTPEQDRDLCVNTEAIMDQDQEKY